METYDVLVAHFVYLSMTVFIEVGKGDDRVKELVKRASDTYDLFTSGDRWDDLLDALSKIYEDMDKLRRRTKDKKSKELLSMWLVFLNVLKAISHIREGRLRASADLLEKAKRMATRLKYMEPYAVVTALLASVRFRLGEDALSLVDDLNILLEPMGGIGLVASSLLYEALIYVVSEISSDLAFKYVVEYGLTIKSEREYVEKKVYLERLQEAMDAILIRLAYEMKVGKVMDEEIEWVEEANEFLNWVEGGGGGDIPKSLMEDLYMKLLQYAVLRSKDLEGDPLRVKERLKRASRKLKQHVEFMLYRLSEEDIGGGGPLKA